MVVKKRKYQIKHKKYLFGISANFPEAWLSKGRDLKRGAEIILNSRVDDHLYMFLMAFSFENLFKGILICNDLRTESKLTLKNWTGLDHDLLRLSKKCKI